MSLIECKECSKKISHTVESCPHCGVLINGKSILTKDLGFGGFIYVLLIMLGLFMVFYRFTDLIGWFFILSGVILLLIRLKLWVGIGKSK